MFPRFLLFFFTFLQRRNNDTYFSAVFALLVNVIYSFLYASNIFFHNLQGHVDTMFDMILLSEDHKHVRDHCIHFMVKGINQN